MGLSGPINLPFQLDFIIRKLFIQGRYFKDVTLSYVTPNEKLNIKQNLAIGILLHLSNINHFYIDIKFSVWQLVRYIEICPKYRT